MPVLFITLRLCLECVQLVCFYYVLTTFTTVGYGMLPFVKNICKYLPGAHDFGTDLKTPGDIFAVTQGERVCSPTSCPINFSTRILISLLSCSLRRYSACSCSSSPPRYSAPLWHRSTRLWPSWLPRRRAWTWYFKPTLLYIQGGSCSSTANMQQNTTFVTASNKYLEHMKSCPLSSIHECPSKLKIDTIWEFSPKL